MDELKERYPEFIGAFINLTESDFFQEIKSLNDDYSKEIQQRYIDQTKAYVDIAHDIVGETKTQKVIFMPFTPELFSEQPGYFAERDNIAMVKFSIPLSQEQLKQEIGWDYREGIESVMLFHEKLHGYIPTKGVSDFQNSTQRELDCHLKHAIIELMANGEMGVQIGKFDGYFVNPFHIGKIYQKSGEVLTTEDFSEYGIKDNKLLHTELYETQRDGSKMHFSENEMGLIKIRGMMYPYTLMYKSRNSNSQLQDVLQQMNMDEQKIKEVYGEQFWDIVSNEEFLLQVQKEVQPYDSLISFAEGMSKELLGIEQIKIRKKDISMLAKEKNVAMQKENVSAVFEDLELTGIEAQKSDNRIEMGE